MEDEDDEGYCWGSPARVTQGESPVWEPLMEAVGERLVGTFMWMYEEEMADGTILHVYKHIHTRRYMHLSTDGRAFAYTPCGMRWRTEISHAIEEALCSWCILSGWDDEDAAAVRDAVHRASERETQKHIKKHNVD
jgi:hypothetical protein